MTLLAFALGCDPGVESEVENWKCVGPLVDLVRWRDGVDAEVLFRGASFPDLAAREQEHVDAAVATLRSRRLECEMTWSMLLLEEPDNPALLLRERAVQRILTEAR